MYEGEIKDAVGKGLAAFERIASALESIAKATRWGWRQEKKRQKGFGDLTSPLTEARLSVGDKEEVCVYCQAKSRRVMRGNLLVGCVRCITEAFGASLRREAGI